MISSIATGKTLGFADDARPELRVGREPGHDARQRRRDRVEAGNREHVHDVHDLVVVEAVAVELEVHELVEQVVVARTVGAPFVEPEAQVRAQLEAGGPTDHLGLVAGGRFVLEDAILHRDEERRVLDRQPEDPQEDGRRQRDAERIVQLDLPVADEAVDELIGQLADVGLERRHLPRREQRVQQLAVVTMDIAVEVQRDQRVVGPHAHDDRSDVGIASGGDDVVHPEEADAHLPPHHRHGPAYLVERVLRHLDVERPVRVVRDERPQLRAHRVERRLDHVVAHPVPLVVVHDIR